MTRHDDESLLELARWALGAVAGCAAPLWCRLVGHGPLLPCNEGAAEVEQRWREREPERVARIGYMVQPAELKLPRWDE